MSLRDTTFTVSGFIKDVDFANQQVTVNTFQGETYYNVPVFSQYLSAADQTGYHAFPKQGDFCKLTCDTDRWYVSAFMPVFDPTGGFVTDRPPLYRAGSVHMSADLSTVDVLPSIAGSDPVVFATQKYGITIEDPVFGADLCAVPASSTTLDNAPVFDLFSILRRKFPQGTCDEITGVNTTTTTVPLVTRIDNGNVLVNTAVGIVINQTLSIYFSNAVDVFKNGRFVAGTHPPPDTPGVKLNIPGLDPALYSLLTVPTYDSTANTISGPATVTVLVSSALPSGVYDLTFTNTANGAAVTAFGGLSIHNFTAGSFKKTYFSTGNNTIGFTDTSVFTSSSTPADIGLLFGINKDFADSIIEELDKTNVIDSNSKYFGVSGTFSDFIGLFDPTGDAPLDLFGSSTLSGFSTCSEDISGNNTALLSQLSATIVGVNDDPTVATSITTRLTAAKEVVEIHTGDPLRHNLGVQISNFSSTDKFKITVFRNIPKVAPDYTQNPRLDSFSPKSFYAPLSSVQVQLNGENIRYGSSFKLVRNTEITNYGLSTQGYIPITGNKAVIDLGSDSLNDITLLKFTNSNGSFPANTGELMSGNVRVTRVSDVIVGFTFVISFFANSVTSIPPFGDYDLVVSHPGQPSDETLVKAIRIVPPPAGATTTGTVSSSSSASNNVVLQKVIARATSDTTMFSYAVDEQGRCDINATGGFYVNGRSLSGGTNSFVGSIGTTGQSIDFATETGDGALITDDGSIFIAAYRKSSTDNTKGNVHIHAQNCFSAGQSSNECFVGRKAKTAQFGTLAPEAHLGGLALPMVQKFPANLNSNFALVPTGSSLSSVGPLLVPDENFGFDGQVFATVTPVGDLSRKSGATIPTTSAGFAGARFVLRSRATLPDGYLIEGNIELIFVPDGGGKGTDTEPFTGSWHIPLV